MQPIAYKGRARSLLHAAPPTFGPVGPFELLRLESKPFPPNRPGRPTRLFYKLRQEEDWRPADDRLWRFIKQAEKVYGREEYLLGLPVLVALGSF